MKMKEVTILTDFGEAFVDENGSFPCGTTDEQKRNAVKVVEGADYVIEWTDVHPRSSSEFVVNGGLYLTHNLLKKDQYNLEELGVQPGQTVNPTLTKILYDAVKHRRSGLIVPRHVFFQDYNGESDYRPSFTFQDVEDTFGVQKLDAQEFLDGGIDRVVNAKHMFNGAGLQSTEWLGHVHGVPDMEMNAATLLKQQYGQGKDLRINVTGVVMSICVYQ
ncbi:hypothetical protein ACFL0V_07550, partial [Nanoarchaeota archaeon]